MRILPGGFRPRILDRTGTLGVTPGASRGGGRDAEGRQAGEHAAGPGDEGAAAPARGAREEEHDGRDRVAGPGAGSGAGAGVGSGLVGGPQALQALRRVPEAVGAVPDDRVLLQPLDEGEDGLGFVGNLARADGGEPAPGPVPGTPPRGLLPAGQPGEDGLVAGA